MCNCQKHWGIFCLLLKLQEVTVAEFDRNTESNNRSQTWKLLFHTTTNFHYSWEREPECWFADVSANCYYLVDYGNRAVSFWTPCTKRGMICKMNFMKQIFFMEPLHWYSLSLIPWTGSRDQTADRHHISLSNCFPIKNLYQTKTPWGRAGHEEWISEWNP